jgi:hypothetical protein
MAMVSVFVRFSHKVLSYGRNNQRGKKKGESGRSLPLTRAGSKLENRSVLYHPVRSRAGIRKQEAGIMAD